MQQNDRPACCRAALLVSDLESRGADRLHCAASRNPDRQSPPSASRPLTVSTPTDLVMPSPIPRNKRRQNRSLPPGWQGARIRWGLVGLRHGPGEHVSLAIEGSDQAIDPVRSQDRSKFGAPGPHPPPPPHTGGGGEQAAPPPPPPQVWQPHT